MKYRFMVLVLFGSLTAQGASVQFDHHTGILSCGKESSGPGACAMGVREGEPLTITFINSVPELLDRKVTITEQHKALRGTILEILKGGAVPGAAKAGGGKPPERAVPTSLQDAYDDAERAILRLSDAVSSADMEHFSRYKQHLRAAVTGLISAAGGADAVPDKLKTVQLQRPASELPDWWRNVRALNAVSDATTTLPAETTFVVDDLQIVVEFTSKNPLIKAPQPLKATVVQSSGWQLSNSTGFAASKLVDDHYTVRTVTDKEATTTTPAVTHREAIREEPDAAAAEATYFIHLRYLGKRHAALPGEISFGVGLATGIKGRIYAGVSYPLGRAGALTFGIAGGMVKRLSRNVNRLNLGDADPEATRRDVFHSAPFVALSWRLDN